MGSASVRVIDYKEGFSEFWQNGLQSEEPTIAGEELDWNEAGVSVMIVGVQPPEQNALPKCLAGINVSDHLTALSWVASWRLRHPGATTRFAVIGFESADIEGSVPSALATLFSAQGPGVRPFVPRIAFFNRPDLITLMSWLRLDEEMGENIVWPTLPLLRSCVWDGLSSTREQHHSFSNVLGAFLLGAQFHKSDFPSGPFSIQNHLTALIQSIGVDTESSEDGAARPRDNRCWVNAAASSLIGGAVLLDDMAELWGDFLHGALGFNNTHQQNLLTTGRDFAYEIQSLPFQLSRFVDSDAHFLSGDVLIPGPERIGEQFVLFLDLRLFADPETLPADDARMVAKAKFFKNLADFGLKLLDSPRNLPWVNDNGKALLRKELKRFSPNASEKRSNRSQLQGLPPEESLLPRLLSLLDPTLPIIIFSSTHHSHLIDPFRGYGNIITAFRKPILSGMTRDWNDIVDALHSDFSSALEQAASILAARSLLKQLETPTP